MSLAYRMATEISAPGADRIYVSCGISGQIVYLHRIRRSSDPVRGTSVAAIKSSHSPTLLPMEETSVEVTAFHSIGRGRMKFVPHAHRSEIVVGRIPT